MTLYQVFPWIKHNFMPLPAHFFFTLQLKTEENMRSFTQLFGVFQSFAQMWIFSVTSLVGQRRLQIDSLHLFSEASGEGEGL